MDYWRFSARNLELFGELSSIDRSLTTILDAVALEINRFEPTLLGQWRDEGLTPKIQSYGLRYLVPFYELLMYEQKTGVVDALVIQLLSCVSWRHFDNCVDIHEPIATAHVASLLSCLRLHAYSQPRAAYDIRVTLERHYGLMTQQAIAEKTGAIELADIWKRCSVFMFAAEDISQLSSESMDLFKCYINYSGVAHDAHDLFSDFKDGVKSLPARWMKEASPDEVLSIATVRALYERVRREVKSLEEMFETFDAGRRFPLIYHLWSESWKTIHDD